jgi:hypothetical protein
VLLVALLSGCAQNHQEDEFDVSHDRAIVYAFDAKSENSEAVIYVIDVQIENSRTEFWYLLTKETVVIAIDRDRTNIDISSWQDLAYSEVSVSIPNTAPVSRLTVAALCYGLGGENFTLNPAVRLLEPLHQKGLLKLDDEEASIQICFDSDAAVRIESGENIEIIIPSEGTLTYKKGLLSDMPLDLTERLYQDAGQPTPGTVSDYRHLNNTMQDWTRVLRREILHIHLFRSADQWEHIVFAAVFITAFVVWTALLMRRSQKL